VLEIFTARGGGRGEGEGEGRIRDPGLSRAVTMRISNTDPI
jgi:hypothetical protein